VERESSRPDFLVSAYGAIGYRASGDAEDPSAWEDLTVAPNTPPAFLVHADNDRLSAEKSVRFYLALKKAGVQAELHVYAKGGHGFGIEDNSLHVSGWPKRCQEWMENQGLLRSRTINAYPGKTPALDGKISPGEWNDSTEFFGVTDWVPQFSPTTDPKDL